MEQMQAETVHEEQQQEAAAGTHVAVEEPTAAQSEEGEPEESSEQEEVPAEQLFIVAEAPAAAEDSRQELKALIEAVVYITDEPLTLQQIVTAAQQPEEIVQEILDELVAEYSQPGRGLTIREIAGGYKMGTRPEHHEAIRTFVRNLKPPLKLSLPALETLAVIAYKQPITAPEIMDIRGVQGAGVLKTLLDRKLIATAGRKNVIGKPILYKTTKEFLVQFGLRDVSELPTLKEFEELGRLALTDAEEPPAVEPEPQPDGDPRPVEPDPNEPGPAPQPEGDPPNEAPPERLQTDAGAAADSGEATPDVEPRLEAESE
jgi:segregation and condensation protein B